MKHYYYARYPTEDWLLAYMFSLVYFPVEVCLEGVFPHYISTRRDPCVRVYAPLTLLTPHPLHLHQWVRLSIISQLSIVQQRAVCFQFNPFPCGGWENIYMLCLIIIIKSETWTITHCLGLRHETMVCAVCLSIFLLYNSLQQVQHRTKSRLHTCFILTQPLSILENQTNEAIQ